MSNYMGGFGFHENPAPGQNNQNNGYNFSPFGNNSDNGYVNYPLLRENERKNICRLGKTTGLCVMAFCLLQNAFLYFLSIFNLTDIYSNNFLFSNSFSILVSFITVFLPFFFLTRFSPETDKVKIFNFQKPRSAKLLILSLVAAFFICMLANYISSSFAALLEGMGLNSQIPNSPVPSGALDTIFYILSIAVVPPLVEEFALRGVVMQPLRKYGDRFAILISAGIFALLHGNAAQILFAFIVGITIGYFTIATGSIWTGVAIHFANNLFSCLWSLSLEHISSSSEKIYSIIMLCSILLGSVCLAFFMLDKNRTKLHRRATLRTTSQNLSSYIFTFPMICSLAFLAISIFSSLFALQS